MFALAKLVVLFAASLSVTALPSHVARGLHNHRGIAARVAHPVPAPEVQVAARDTSVPVRRAVRRKRAGTGRCRPQSSSDLSLPSPSPIPSSTSKDDPKPTSYPPEQSTSIPQEDPKPTSTPKPASTPHEESQPSTSPQETPTPKPETSTPAPSPTPTPDSGTGGGDTYSGQGTFYATGLGACGITNNDNQDIAAVSHSFFDSYPGYNGVNPNNNPMCSKTAKVTFNGKTIYVKLTDRCEGCAYGDLDFSPHAFNQLSDPSVGRISGISWQIVD